MSFAPALRSAQSGEWCTPPALVAALARRFGPFTLDAAATPENAVCPRYLTAADDALAATTHWQGGVVYCNPPYGRGIGRWLDRALTELAHGCALRVVFLLPARTDTRWFQLYAPRATTVAFLRGRVRFSGVRVGAPFPSLVLVFDADRPQEPAPTLCFLDLTTEV